MNDTVFTVCYVVGLSLAGSYLTPPWNAVALFFCFGGAAAIVLSWLGLGKRI